jgi:hypothetical protein
MFEDTARADLKAEHTRKYVSISNWLTTQYSDIRWSFKAGFTHIVGFLPD